MSGKEQEQLCDGVHGSLRWGTQKKMRRCDGVTVPRQAKMNKACICRPGFSVHRRAPSQAQRTWMPATCALARHIPTARQAQTSCRSGRHGRTKEEDEKGWVKTEARRLASGPRQSLWSDAGRRGPGARVLRRAREPGRRCAAGWPLRLPEPGADKRGCS